MDDEDEREEAHQAALAMLHAFHRTGANKFDLTITSSHGEKIRFRANVMFADLQRTFPILLDETARNAQNLILRPRGPGMQFIQLDDLSLSRMERVEETAFLALETSPGNFQAWIALSASKDDEDFARRLRKGTGADPSASGATRVAGSYNFKPKYAPDFPQVRITHSKPGHIAMRAQLEDKGLVAAPEPAPARVSPPARPILRQGGSRGIAWPSYQKCLDGAPLNHEQSGADVSRADFMFCLLALDWGHSQETTVTRLMQESTKAQQNGEKYARLTVENAAKAIGRRSKTASR